MIEPDPDWYGSYARRSALADFLELMALQNRSWSVEDLADVIRDNRWMDRLGERIDGPPESARNDDEVDEGEIAAELDEALERAYDITAVIGERHFAAEDHYPFAMEESGRVTYSGGDPLHDPYVRLLCITVGHALRVDVPVLPHVCFESVVASALANFGIATTGIGARSRQGDTFHTILTDSAGAVGLSADPLRAQARTFANDEGSDILSNIWIGDPRPGGLQLIGQVTCAKSNDWDKKIQEPSPSQWRSWLGGQVPPVAYLAVPHHVEDVMRTYLMGRRERDVFDRLRLAPLLPDDYSDGEGEILDRVLALSTY